MSQEIGVVGCTVAAKPVGGGPDWVLGAVRLISC